MRIEALTSLRFFAAILVVIFHFGRNTQLADIAKPFIISGPQMVTFFFVLSGFVMLVAHYHKKNEGLRKFYVARIARIVPVYILALLLVIFLYYGKGNNNITSVLLSVTFLQSWFTPYPLSLNSPAWSLSVEALFYVSFPLVLFVIRSSRISEVKLLFISVVFYFLTQAILSNLMTINSENGFSKTLHDMIYYFPVSHYCSFLLGVSGGYIYVKNREKFNQSGYLSAVILVIAFLFIYILLQYPKIPVALIGFPLAYGSSFYSLFFLILILCVAYSRNIMTMVLSFPLLVLLGESSYALYILQKPLHALYSGIIAEHLSLGENGHFYLFSSMLIAISILVFVFIEKPGKQLIFKIDSYVSRKI